MAGLIEARPVPGGEVRLVAEDDRFLRLERMKDGRTAWTARFDVTGGDRDLWPSQGCRLVRASARDGVVVVETEAEHTRGGSLHRRQVHEVDLETGRVTPGGEAL
ncbi:MAG: hypothetical protein KIT58_20605 [Planctomycetota bacterium]|nr:hypothetical protein [Planctomycetota bacterium]